MDIGSADPKGLIRESYRIEAISAAECRSIFVDWALSLPDGMDYKAAVPVLLATYAADQPGHPMTPVLNAALQGQAPAGRKGGRAARLPSA